MASGIGAHEALERIRPVGLHSPLDGCPALGQDEHPDLPGLLPRQPYQAAQHDPEHRHADEETLGQTGVRHRPLHAGPG
jgi:hypothetical protein